MATGCVVGVDLGVAMTMADALGYDRTAMAELLPSCEGGMVAGFNDRIGKDAE